jgi:hypothetical protein
MSMAAENPDRPSVCTLSVSDPEHTIARVRRLKRKKKEYETWGGGDVD